MSLARKETQTDPSRIWTHFLHRGASSLELGVLLRNKIYTKTEIKSMQYGPPYSPNYTLNGTATVLLQGWPCRKNNLWRLIGHSTEKAIKSLCCIAGILFKKMYFIHRFFTGAWGKIFKKSADQYPNRLNININISVFKEANSSLTFKKISRRSCKQLTKFITFF